MSGGAPKGLMVLTRHHPRPQRRSPV